MKYKINNKAQMKIQQMSFMLLGVFIFFVLVGMFIIMIKLSGLKDSANRLQEENAMLLITKLANSPEFSCGSAFGTEKSNCIDADKVMILKQNIQKYTGFWGVSNIEIRKIYPENKNISCNSTNYPKCDIIKLIDKSNWGDSKSSYVAWCYKTEYNGEIVNKCELAKLIVRYEGIK